MSRGKRGHIKLIKYYLYNNFNIIDIFFRNVIYLVVIAVKISKFMQDFKQSKYVIDEEISEKS
jgi:hypothetical protein